MVEDEFLATAQLFTSHLHHAEYIRLKRLAAARNTAANSFPNTNNVAAAPLRPTDFRTAMRGETKQKRKAERRREGNEKALERMKKDARSAVAGSDDSSNLDSDSGGDEDGGGPWAGTSLHKLMAPVARKNLTSLSGLQGIQSSTRAAKGYTKPEETSQRRSAESTPRKMTRTIDPATSRHQEHPKRLLTDRSASESADEADSDLDAPPIHHHHRYPPSKPSTTTRPLPPAHSTSKANPLTLAASDLFHRTPSARAQTPPPPIQKRPTASTSPPRAKHKPPSPNKEDEAAAARKRLKMRRERAAAVRNKEGGNGRDVRIDEIPVFLV
ncbi:MAG: hypothetical protein Q9201_000882 [Fulgogasparrea decipioides]